MLFGFGRSLSVVGEIRQVRHLGRTPPGRDISIVKILASCLGNDRSTFVVVVIAVALGTYDRNMPGADHHCRIAAVGTALGLLCVDLAPAVNGPIVFQPIQGGVSADLRSIVESGWVLFVQQPVRYLSIHGRRHVPRKDVTKGLSGSPLIPGIALDIELIDDEIVRFLAAVPGRVCIMGVVGPGLPADRDVVGVIDLHARRDAVAARLCAGAEGVFDQLPLLRIGRRIKCEDFHICTICCPRLVDVYV